MVLYCMTLPGFEEGIRFMFTPDFSVLTHADLWVAAFGQAFFSLSVGMGIMLTYGAYMAKEQNISRSALIISIADISVALLAGMVIFPGGILVWTLSYSRHRTRLHHPAPGILPDPGGNDHRYRFFHRTVLCRIHLSNLDARGLRCLR